MKVSYYQLVIESNVRVLGNLSHLLDKAVEHVTANRLDERALLDARLFPDMFPFTRQVQMVCDMTKYAAAWLTGKEAPRHEDNEASFAELKTRIDKAIAWLKTFRESDFDNSAEREVRLPWKPAKVYRGEVFLLQHSIPNIYFHITTAYNLLRHNGVPIGKMDYLGQM